MPSRFQTVEALADVEQLLPKRPVNPDLYMDDAGPEFQIFQGTAPPGSVLKLPSIATYVAVEEVPKTGADDAIPPTTAGVAIEQLNRAATQNILPIVGMHAEPGHERFTVTTFLPRLLKMMGVDRATITPAATNIPPDTFHTLGVEEGSEGTFIIPAAA